MFRANSPNPGRQICRKRSVVWRFYKAVDSESVQCLLCKGFQSRQCHGSTTGMLRHLRIKHPKEVSRKCKGLIPKSTNGHLDMETDGEQFCSVEVALEDGDSDIPTIVDEPDIHSSINGIVEAAQGGSAEQMTHEEASNDRPVTHTGHKRSLIWKYFDHLGGLDAARCHTCMKELQFSETSSTSNLRRHLSNRHPDLFAKLLAETCRLRQSKSAPSSNTYGDTSTAPGNVAATQHKVFSVEVAMEDADSDIPTIVDESDIHSSINGIMEAAQGGSAEQMTHEEASNDRPVTHTGHKRSLIWKYFDHLDGLDAVCCHTCMKKLQFSETSSTSNLRRHLSNRHPELFAKLLAETCRVQQSKSAPSSNTYGDTSTAPQNVAPTQHKVFSVEVALEDGDSDTPTVVNESDTLSPIAAAAQGSPAEQMTHEEASNDRPVTHKGHKRSLIWKYFDHLKSLDAARCHICMKKLHCSDSSGTGNLRRHMSNRHPELFAELSAETHTSRASNAAPRSNANGDTRTAPWTRAATQHKLFSDVLKHSRVSDGEKRVLRRERELIEALRRAQKEEAQALEHQRELLEKLRSAEAREAAAEREKIESLRKAQQEEAKDLSRQREDLQKEKEELQKKWEELQQEREELVLLPQGR